MSEENYKVPQTVSALSGSGFGRQQYAFKILTDITSDSSFSK